MLMAERQVTPAKGRAPRHNQSKSASHNTSVFANPVAPPTAASPQSAQKQRRSNDQALRKNQQQPTWDVPSTEMTGYFDAEGKFIESGADTNTETDEGVVYTGRQPQQRSGRRGRQRGPSGNVTSAQQQHNAVVEGRTSSPRHVPQQPQQQQYVSQPTATPAKAAYAGPAFHASPAPSSIPIPKFYSKSVPLAGANSGLQARLEAEEDENGSPPLATVAPTQSETGLVQPIREVTPLDMLFKADRAEKEKERSGSCASTPRIRPGNTNPMTEPAPTRVWADIYGNTRPHHQRHASGGAIFNMDMDNENPKNACGGYFQGQQYVKGSLPAGVSPGAATQDKAQLKHFLNSIQSPYQQHHRTPPHAQSSGPLPQGFHSPSPFYQSAAPSHSGPTTPVHHANMQDPMLHYGNRNLSPLFQAAAKNGNQKRNSGLRQEAQNGPPMPAQNQLTHPPDPPIRPRAQGARSTPPFPTNSNAPEGERDPSVKTLEDSLKKMLNLPGS